MRKAIVDGKEKIVYESLEEVVEAIIDKIANELELKIDLQSGKITIAKKQKEATPK